MTKLSVNAFSSNQGGQRGLRLGIDSSLWIGHTSVLQRVRADGENPELKMLFFRCAKFLALPVVPLFVFDGPKRPEWKRGKKISRKDSWMLPAFQNMIQSFGFQWCWVSLTHLLQIPRLINMQAPGEAEAELAYLNNIGAIDAVLTDDVDAFLFGAQTVIRKYAVDLVLCTTLISNTARARIYRRTGLIQSRTPLERSMTSMLLSSRRTICFAPPKFS